VSLRKVEETYKIFVDKSSLAAPIEALGKLNYYKLARPPDEAGQFMNEMSALDASGSTSGSKRGSSSFQGPSSATQSSGRLTVPVWPSAEGRR
jgi:hypothetical protein